MKNLSLKEQLQNNLRALQIDDVREYHLTHDFYSGQELNSNCRVQEAKNDSDYKVLMEQQDLDYMNRLLFPHPTMESTFSNLLPSNMTINKDKTYLEMALPKLSDDLLHRLTSYYDQYLNYGLSTALENQADKLSLESIVLIKSIYGENTIIIKNICILSEFWIRSPFSWTENTGTSLLDHLFVEYQAPTCLKKCWHRTATQENLQWLIVYILYAQGGSVKQIATNFDWKVSNNKLWHYLFQAPARLSAREAVRYCEVKRLKASDEIYQCLYANEAYAINVLSETDQNSIDFWYSMVRWLVANEEQIIGTEMSRILVWARHQFTEFERAGKLFSMNGRSCSKVQKETLEYYRAIVARRVEMARRAELRRLAAITRQEETETREAEARLIAYQYAGYESYRWDKIGLSWSNYKNTVFRWKFVELSSSEELFEEGEAMNNCVAGYDESCHDGLSIIVSLQCNDERKVTIEIDPESRTLVQALGYDNRCINSHEKLVITEWLNECVSN